MVRAAAALEIGFHREFKLLDKHGFEIPKVVLFVQKEEGFFVIQGIDGSERKRAVVFADQEGIANDSICQSKGFGSNE